MENADNQIRKKRESIAESYRKAGIEVEENTLKGKTMILFGFSKPETSKKESTQEDPAEDEFGMMKRAWKGRR